MNANRPELDALSSSTVGCACTVAKTLVSGILEKVYENALAVELRATGVAVVELKTVQALDRAHRTQCMHCLRATGLHLCRLRSFAASRLEIRRVVHNL